MIIDGGYFFKDKRGNLEPLCFYDEMTKSWFSSLDGEILTSERARLLIILKKGVHYDRRQLLKLLRREEEI